MISYFAKRRCLQGIAGLVLFLRLAIFGLIVATAQSQTAAAGEPIKISQFGDPESKAVALRVHSEAAAFDKLPQFYYHVEAGDGDVETMLDMEECSLDLLKKSLDEPISRDRWSQCDETLAWSGRQALWSMSGRKYKNETQVSAVDAFRQDRVWTMDGAFERSKSDVHPAAFDFVSTPERLWDGRLIRLGYFRVTPHQFWWGRSSNHNDTISDVPPEMATYRFAGRERFDDQLCDVVESAARAERMWISCAVGRLRAVLISRFRGGLPAEPFYKTAVVEKLAGRPIASQKEYQDWVTGLSAAQKTDLSIAWNEEYYARFGPNELIRFRDYREVAPGVWIPFREDRAFTHPVRNGNAKHKYIHLWAAVEEARTDIDLTDTIQSLQPQDGDKVKDLRFGVVLNYTFRRDRTQSELLELVEAEKQKLAADEEFFKRMPAPIAEMIGKPAPALPAEGWIGGEAPKVAGRPYLVHFWATWCGPCKNDLPLLSELAAGGARVVGMHPAGTPADEISKMISANQLGYPTLLASKAVGGDREIGGYPAGIFPYYVVVDREGRVAGHGPLPEMLARLRSLALQNKDADPK